MDCELKELLFSLCAQTGVSGDEYHAAKKAADELSKYMPCSIDAMGNVIGHKDGKGTHILLDAHIDRIGFVVTGVDDSGFVKVACCGGMDMRVLSAQSVTVYGDKPYFGVIASTPPHLQKEKSNKAREADELVLDMGLSAEYAKKHISPGDRATVNGAQFCQGDGIAVSPAIDDRAGVAAILETLEILSKKGTDCELSVVFSVQEEVTGLGAQTGAYKANPDEAIVIDVSFAKTPDISEAGIGKAGSGALIGISPAIDRDMFDSLKNTAQKEGISYQIEVMGGRTGTNLDNIVKTRGGVKCALVSIPMKYMHTTVEAVRISDIKSCAEIIAGYISERGKIQ